MSEYSELASEALLKTVLENGVGVGVHVVERLRLNVQGRTRVEIREPVEGREPRLVRLCHLCRRHGLRAAPLAWYRDWRFGRRRRRCDGSSARIKRLGRRRPRIWCRGWRLLRRLGRRRRRCDGSSARARWLSRRRRRSCCCLCRLHGLRAVPLAGGRGRRRRHAWCRG
jgi:hypothetical protein